MKKLLLLFIFVAFTVFMFANPVNIVKAEQVAGNWIKGSQRNVTIFETKPIIKNGKTLWYFISLKPQGFILISADDAAYPILGYSYEHNFDYPIQSPEVKFWIEHYEKQLYDIIQNRLGKVWKTVIYLLLKPKEMLHHFCKHFGIKDNTIMNNVRMMKIPLPEIIMYGRVVWLRQRHK